LIPDDIFALLLIEPLLQGFTSKKIADASASTEVLIALSAASREEVDTLVDRAVAAGAVNYAEPRDRGFMYQRSVQDLDGYLWEIIWMDPANVHA
jgi:predicted lactoylglutathione lyase